MAVYNLGDPLLKDSVGESLDLIKGEISSKKSQPIKIEEIISNIINLFSKTDFIEVLITSAKFILVTKPILSDISWSTIVENVDKIIAQINEYPKEAPAIVQRVTVPGPINAAAIKTPGPISLNHFIMELESYLQVILHLEIVYLFHTMSL